VIALNTRPVLDQYTGNQGFVFEQCIAYSMHIQRATDGKIGKRAIK